MRTLTTMVVALMLLITSGVRVAGAEPDAPTTTEELLSGFVTEEVEPGVFRVINDGVRDIGHPDIAFWLDDAVMVGDVGDVWRITPPRRLYKLGQEAEWSYDPGLVGIDQTNTEAAPDGRLWTVAVSEDYRIFDGDSWEMREFYFGDHFDSIAVQGDGTVWLRGEDLLTWLTPDALPDAAAWTEVYEGEWIPPELAVTDDGVAWLVSLGDEAAIEAFLRFDGNDWEVIPGPDDIVRASPQGRSFDVAADGTLWTTGDAEQLHRSLARLDDGGWTIFTAADGVEPWGEQPVGYLPTDIIRAAPDGSAWVNATDEGTHTCDGLARFDGETWTPYLSGRCISDLDFASDGSVWVVARSPDFKSEVDTYVITPEAVAAAE